ncbi:aminomethyl-transferring glycine dehydrogenase subunit GcvPA [Sporosalibacterium faouarense]|uniref:aminomethyl-transferring glycine dehydrogenase subunit GcvPA n=1 Tax=Sporosalibacterium faouarense TaxID=516123 RepID=UPI00141C4182|nr:aminomethyl-transferring glycine dehydrogenase subunit GcvPA [Sporosalibacterium faouarense]MTI49269.1 aminomethyl-transferring glycine dehydrogenase subunit GcvPA [Bacillota bacterium]
MYPYIPNTKKDEEKMLSFLGIDSVEELFSDIPKSIRLDRELDLDPSKSEEEVRKTMKDMAKKNLSADDYTCFLGAGSYDHTIPSIVPHLISRSEFYTSYTPYQAEISQGTLQAIFEFQTMIADITGMYASNASMYDGPTATAEAALLAAAQKKGNTVIISKTVHPEVREVVKTYMKIRDINVIEIDAKDGVTDFGQLESNLSKDTVGVIVQNPNFYGIVEDYTEVEKVTHDNKALLIMNVDPISLGMLKTPGEYGADIAVGEGQPLGNSLNFGGPYLGFMATTKKLMRKMPGRIVGQTVDKDGKRAFTLTLQAREQHIRREKATSNICSNQALNALAATIFMAVLGKNGLTQMAEQTAQKAYYAYNKLIETGKFKPVFQKPFFREFVLESEIEVERLNKELLKHNILGGYSIERDYPLQKNQILLCVTEKRTKEEIDYLVKVMEEII